MTESDNLKIEAVYIAFFQTPYDTVKYLLPGINKAVSKPYKQFLKFLFENFKVNDRAGIIQNLESFETIFLTEDGEFQILKNKKNPFDISFSDLHALNSKEEELKKSVMEKKMDSGMAMLHRAMNEAHKRLRG